MTNGDTQLVHARIVQRGEVKGEREAKTVGANSPTGQRGDLGVTVYSTAQLNSVTLSALLASALLFEVL